MATWFLAVITTAFLIATTSAQNSNYYVNITERVLQLPSLPFHYTSVLLDDSIILDADKKWVSVYENGGSCLTARCSKDTESCFNIKKYSEVTQEELVPVSKVMQRFLEDDGTSSTGEETKYMLLSDVCLPNQFCDINLNMNGVCTNKTAGYVQRELLTVGQECTDDMYWSMCGSGKMKCEGGRCAAVDGGMLCQTSNDCWPNRYCDIHGQCVQPKKAREPCTEQEECGRSAACFFADLRGKYGECVEYFSKINGESVATYTGHDLLFSNGGNTSIICKCSFHSRATSDESAVSIWIFER